MTKKRHKPLIGEGLFFFRLKADVAVEIVADKSRFLWIFYFLCYFCPSYKKYSMTRVYCAELVLIV